MSLWGNKDSKTATGTIAITTGGAVTGTGTAFTTEAKIGNTITAGGRDYQIVAIASNTAATVISGTNNGNGSVTAVTAGSSYALSEKPAFVAHESAQSAGRTGDSTKVFGGYLDETVLTVLFICTNLYFLLRASAGAQTPAPAPPPKPLSPPFSGPTC